MRISVEKGDSDFKFCLNIQGVGYFLFNQVFHCPIDNTILIIGGDEWEMGGTSLLIDAPQAVEKFIEDLKRAGGKDFSLPEFLRRLIDEKKQLDDRREKLAIFQKGEVFKGLSEERSFQLTKQYLYMSRYSSILEKRIYIEVKELKAGK
jgi:hypothetical protein